MLYFLISLCPLFVFTYAKSKQSLHMLQQNFYNDDERYLIWITRNLNKVFFNIDIFFSIFIVCLFLQPIISYILFGFMYILFSYFYIKDKNKIISKKPLVITPRVKRLFFTIFIFYFIMIISMCLSYDDTMITYYYLILGLFTYLNYFVVMTANFVNKPIEKCVYLYYKNKAQTKLKKMNLDIIGITGSYGKTSSKNIINDILNIKFNSFATPKSFNTPYGLISSINNYLDKFSDIFIAEMGAFKIGEIRQNCKIVHPKYGVITSIGEAHLESFGSRENIQKGKFELIEELPYNGVAILNGDDEYQLNYKIKNKCKVMWIGIDNKDVDLYATNIKLSNNGTTFDCVFNGDNNKYTFNTKLLGKHNVYNILAGILLGKVLGMSIEELQRGVSSIKPIEHRLELKKYGKINIIDDAYNSNPVGSKMAVEVLGLMKGEKIIVTPGMIELGEKQYELNKKFGQYISEVCDYAILIGEKQTRPIYDGLIENKFDKNKIFILNDVREAFPLMNKLATKDTYVLLENDLPDLFTES